MKIEVDIRKYGKIGVLLSVIAAVWLLAGCSDDVSQQDDLEDLHIDLQAVTRAGGESDAEELDTKMADIYVFLSADDEYAPGGKYTTEGTFKHYETTSDDKTIHSWSAEGLKAKPGSRQFSLYGYMPANANLGGTMDVPNNRLTLTNIQPMTDKDLCVVTGVLKSNTIATPLRGNFRFDYINSDYNVPTVLNLMLEHLLGRFEFMFKIGSKYSGLRDIVVTSLTITTETDETITVTVDLPDSPSEEDKVEVTYTTSGSVKEWSYPLLKVGETEIKLDTDGKKIGSDINVAVGTGMSGSYKLVSTYKVYDKKGNMLSERTASNRLSAVLPAMGQKKVIVLTVEPTYLYQLSYYDLDNPTIVISE